MCEVANEYGKTMEERKVEFLGRALKHSYFVINFVTDKIGKTGRERPRLLRT